MRLSDGTRRSRPRTAPVSASAAATGGATGGKSEITDTALPGGVGKDEAENKSPLIRNFRRAASLPRIYRCGSPDRLANLFDDDDEDDGRGDNGGGSNGIIGWGGDSAEDVLLRRAGLILDLRSRSERDEVASRKWARRAPGGGITISTYERERGNISEWKEGRVGGGRRRIVLRIDVLSPSRLFDYLDENWLAPDRTMPSSPHVAAADDERHALRMDALNERGLSGLYEVIVRASGYELSASLRSITEYFEREDGDRTVGDVPGDVEAAAVVHCVQGKDR